MFLHFAVFGILRDFGCALCFVLCARDNNNNKKNCWLFRNAEFRRRGAIKITVKVKHMEELFIILAFYRLRAILF